MSIWPALQQVLGPLCLLLVVLPQSGVSGIDPFSSPTTSAYGPLCDFPNDSARCLFGATCVAPQQCACAQGLGVDGTFFCGSTDEQSIELTGFENTLQPWNTTLEAAFPLPCRSRLTEFVIEKPSKSRTCTFQIFGENKVVNQRVLVVAAEVHLKVEENGQLKFQRGIRLTPGDLDANDYSYLERTKELFTPEGPETFTELPDDSELINSGSGMGEFADDEGFEEDMGGVPVDDEDSANQWSSPSTLSAALREVDQLVIKEVDANSVAVIAVDQCGSEIRFRAADDELLSRGLKPGLAVVLDPDVDNVVFVQAKSYIAGSPQSDVNYNLRQEFGLSQSQILLHTSMAYAAVQGDSDSGELCRDTSFVYRAYCDSQEKKMSAIKNCAAMVLDASTRSCLDLTQQQHGGSLQVFKQCMWVDCSPTFTVCNTLRSELHSDTCLDIKTKEILLANCPP